jgi:hypothetical protein
VAAGGIGAGVIALQLAKQTKANPAVIAGAAAGLGTLGMLLAKPGVFKSLSTGVAALGLGLTAIDLLQKPAAATATAKPQQQQQLQGGQQQQQLAQAEHRQADYVTREDLSDMLRQVLEENERARSELRDEMRNAMHSAGAPSYASPPTVATWEQDAEIDDEPIEFVVHDNGGARNADGVIHEAWHFADTTAA